MRMTAGEAQRERLPVKVQISSAAVSTHVVQQARRGLRQSVQ